MLNNLDMIGNRVAVLAFGLKNVVVIVSRNKVVHGLDDVFLRIKECAALLNADLGFLQTGLDG